MQTSKSKPSAHQGTPPGVSAVLVNASAVVSTMQNPTDGIICQGWMLKKRRKKMQGYARRYFMLTSQGVLSYSFEPGGPVRDAITLKLASITSSASDRSRAIHIDSATSTFHLKALNLTDYALWLSSLRRFCTFAINTHAEESGPTPTMTPRSRRSLSHSRSLTGTWSVGGGASRAVRAAHDMTPTIKDLEDILGELSAATPGKKQKKHHKEKEKDKEHHNKDLFGLLFHRKGQHTSSPPITPSASSSSYDEMPIPSTPSPLPSPTNSVFERLQHSIATLKAQHNALLNVLESSLNSAPTLSNSPLLRIRESGSPTSPRHSISTLESSLWFDAEEGAEEFILTSEPTDSSTQMLHNSDDEGTEVQDEDVASDDSSDDTPLTTGQVTPTKSKTNNAKIIIRRMQLPAPMSGDDGSLLTVLRKNVGKDLSTVSFPVSFNEPISILQRLAEDVEYTDLLTQAVASTDPVERICLIASFAVSGYACTLFRASRKPFNPMLGETFEDVRMNFVSEKVSHHPPVMACHASGKGWEYWATSSADSKFWGRSLEIINKGTTHVKIGDSHYQWKKPSSFMRNLLVGEKYLAHEGELVVTDVKSGYRCVITFKEGGYWGPSRAVTGAVYGPSSSNALAKLDGNWNESLGLQLDPKGSHIRMLWRAHAFPPHSHDYYGFTAFTMSLNEITPDIADFLPPTDSRFRPDQKAMEEGRIEFADAEKARVEGAQRARRKAREERGEAWVPRWFEQQGDEWIYKGGYWEARAKKQWDGSEKLW